MTRPAFETAVDTRLLLQRLNKAAVGETVSYIDLGKEIGREVAGGDPHLQSAIRMAQRDNSAVFACVRKVGYQRLDDRAIVRASESGLGRLKRAARKAGNTLAVVEPSRLENTERDLYHARMGAFAMIAHAAKPSSVAKLANAAREKGQELAIAQTLKALSDGSL